MTGNTACEIAVFPVISKAYCLPPLNTPNYSSAYHDATADSLTQQLTERMGLANGRSGLSL
ncbi:hypothetical protein KSF_101640 [Reticulibacter mediterranei]|uniref:Uncharacterized protein n=1 Tax=Reticulibacter mediterranei TaxID=2778369 RepID=A0A8J3J3K9_9CHLR|nr:hypothetical protein KSF_101640 [Reticulibacter mediterranei]